MATIQTFTGDGTTTTFNFTFPFFGTKDINVTINDIPQTSDDFTVYPTPTPGDADIPYTGGQIVFDAAPANNALIKVRRNIELARHIDYQATAEPKSYQLNQDINQCIEILKEQSETLTNAISLANVPTLSDLLSELQTIRDNLASFLTADDIATLSSTVDDHTTSITSLSGTVGAHTTSITTLSGYDYVVEFQSPTADNNYTWYRKYKSGWIEQGGFYTGNADICYVTLPKAMSNAYYTIMALGDNNTGIAGSYTMVDQNSQTATGFTLLVNFSSTPAATKTIRWFVTGVASA